MDWFACWWHNVIGVYIGRCNCQVWIGWPIIIFKQLSVNPSLPKYQTITITSWLKINIMYINGELFNAIMSNSKHSFIRKTKLFKHFVTVLFVCFLLEEIETTLENTYSSKCKLRNNQTIFEMVWSIWSTVFVEIFTDQLRLCRMFFNGCK